MTDDAPELPGPWPDVLAAYADGELDPAARAAVERWLAAHPGACAEYRTQRQLSPDNWRLWRQAEPPLPDEDTWAAVGDAIAAGVAGPVTPGAPIEAGSWTRAAKFVYGGLAVAVAVAVFAVVGFVRWQVVPKALAPDQAPQIVAADDPLRDYTVLPLASEDDVDIRRVAGNGDGWLPVGDHPLPDALVLAGEDDVELEGAEDHPAWPAGGPQITRGAGDAPMIFAANPR